MSSQTSPWGLKEVFWGLLLLAGIAAGASVLLLGITRGLQLTPETLRTSHLSSISLVLGEAMFVVPAWIFALRRSGAGWGTLGLRRFRPVIGCLGALGLLFLTLWINLAWRLVLQALHWSGQPSIAPLFEQGPATSVLVVLAVSIVAPLSEEIFFRGFCFPPLRRRFGFWLGATLNALLFALLHFTPTVLPPLMLLGLAFCLLYEYTGSIWPGIILHAAINSIALLGAFLISNS